MTVPVSDPWAGADKAPSLSFADAPVGTVKSITITEKARLVQGRDYNTGQPKFWPLRSGETEPKPVMNLVVNGTDDVGEERSVWAQKPSALFAALNEARKTSPTRDFEVGGTLEIKYTGDKPNAENPRLNPAKQYAARYTPPVGNAAAGGADPWAGDAGADGPAF